MSTTGRKPLQCTAIAKRTGQRCTSRALADSSYCVGHDPRGTKWRRAGGKARSNTNRATRLLPRRLEPLVSSLETVFAEVRSGQRTERNGLALARIATSIKELVLAGEIEERTRALERWAAETQREQDEHHGKRPCWGAS